MSEYNYISARPGSGKTNWAINTLTPRYQRSGKNVLMVVPTKSLCDQIVRDSAGRFKTIHTNNSVDVIRSVQALFKTRRMGEAWVITEASFNVVTGRIVADNWIIIKDEATEPLEIQTIKCPDSHYLLKEWLNLEPVTSDQGYRTIFKAISINDKAPVTTSQTDSITGALHKLKESIRNPHLEVLVDDSRMNWETPQLTYSCYIRPDLYRGFDHIYFMSANFEHTYLYHQWRHSGVKWKNSTPSELTQEYDTSRVRLHYWSEVGAWSRARREKSDELRQYIKWINQRIPGDDYIYVSNVSDSKQSDFGLLKGEAIPAVCHGLNKWRNMIKFVSFASYLISAHEEPFYQYYGCSTADARTLRNSQMLYQQLTRTDLRNSDSTNVIDVYLPTLTEVREILPYLPQAVVMDIDKNYDGQATGRNGQLRNDWRCEISIEMPVIEKVPSYALGANTKALTATCFSGDDLLGTSLETNGKASYLVENAPPNIVLPTSFSPSKKKRSIKKWRSSRKINPLIAFIKECAQLSVNGASPEKRADLKRNYLEFFITGIVPDGSRFKKTNVVANNDVIAFDFDGTELKLRDISRIFCGLEYLLYTTVSHDPSSGVGRYRIVLPVSRTMNLTEHMRVMNFWCNEIAAYSKKHHCLSGLDEKCLGAERKFYVPHLESEIKHIYDDKSVMDVDVVLSKTTRGPIVSVPGVIDIQICGSQLVKSRVHSKDNKMIQRIDGILNTMCPGDRSHKAVQIGGIMRHSQLNHSQREQIFQRMRRCGVSKAALKSSKTYSEL